MENYGQESYDVIIIGAGTGGVTAASRARELGLSVCLIESGDMGGTCLNRGCIPTKVMAGAAHTARLLSSVYLEMGFGFDQPVPHRWPALLDRCRSVVGSLQKGLLARLKRAKIVVKKGKGFLQEPHHVEIVGPDAGRIKGEKIIFALGSSPASIPGVVPNGESILTSDDIFKIPERPASIVVVGGGAVGCEFASIFAAFGTRVTLLEMMDDLIPGADRDVVKRLVSLLKRRKIDVRTGARLAGIAPVESHDGEMPGLQITVETSQSTKGTQGTKGTSGTRGTRGTEVLSVEKVLLAVGRTFATGGIGLQEAGVATEKGAITVNAHMQTSLPGHYAVGDCIGGKLLAHVAAMEGRVAAENAAGAATKMSYRFVPWTVFTDPEVAWVGMTEEEAVKRGIQVIAQKVPFSSASRAWVDGEKDGILKVVADVRSGVVIGVHAIGPGVSNMAGEITVALKSGLTVEDWGQVIHAHPTMSEILMETFQQMSASWPTREVEAGYDVAERGAD